MKGSIRSFLRYNVIKWQFSSNLILECGRFWNGGFEIRLPKYHYGMNHSPQKKWNKGETDCVKSDTCYIASLKWRSCVPKICAVQLIFFPSWEHLHKNVLRHVIKCSLKQAKWRDKHQSVRLSSYFATCATVSTCCIISGMITRFYFCNIIT